MSKQKKSKEYLKSLAKVFELIATRQPADAVDQAEKLMRAYPDAPGGYFLLGLYAFSQRDFGNAIKLFDMAHERDPECREYADCLAVLYTVIGKLADGLYFAKLSTALDSDPDIRPLVPLQLSNYFEALDRIEPSQHYVNALLLFNVGQFEEAARSCELELKENDRHDGCYMLLGKCHLRLGNYDKAVSALHAAIHLNPDDAEYFGLLGSALCHLGRFDEAFVCHRVALDRDPESLDRATAALLDAEYLPDSMEPTRAELRKELERRIAARPASKYRVKRKRTENARIRIAYLSNAFQDSEQAHFISALIRNHDRSRFEIVGYQQSFVEDSVNVDLKNFTDSWRKIIDVQDPVMERIINGDEIDVLVDLCGYTPWNRAALVATHAAPVQIAWLEPLYGLGTQGINVVLSDKVTHESDKKAVGKGQDIVRLNVGLLALEPFTFFPEVGALPADTAGRLTFGGHCDLARLSPETAAGWSRVLAATGRSKLLLGDAGDISGAVKNHVIDLFGHFGTADRIAFWDEQPDDHLNIAFFSQIDVLLDTYPVNGRLNICKALWMGVPVLSLKGSRRVSLTGASILHAAGCAEWVCESVEQMTALATAFSEDLDGLAAIRRGLRDKVAASGLFSPRALVESLEGVYMTALEMRRRKGANPTGKARPPKRASRKKPAAGKKAATKVAAAKTAARKTMAGKSKSPVAKRKRRT